MLIPRNLLNKVKNSLLAKISAFLLLLVLVSGSATAYLVYKSSSDALKSSITTNLANTTGGTMDTVDRFLYERLVDVGEISGREQIQRFLAQPSSQTNEFSATLIKQLNEFKTLMGTWSDFTIVDTAGKVALSTDAPQLALELSKQPEFTALYEKSLKGQSTYSDVISEGTSRSPIMLFMTPIRDEQKSSEPIIGVFVGELAWQSTLESIKTFGNFTATLVNAKGISLGNSLPSGKDQVLQKDLSNSKAFQLSKKATTGSGILPGLEDTKTAYLSTYTKEAGFLEYKGNGWTLIVQSPKNSAFLPAEVLAKKLVFISFVILIFSSILLVLLLRNNIIKPLTRLKVAAGLLSTGNFKKEVEVNSEDEIGELGKAFNNMAHKLQAAYSSLRSSIKDTEDEKIILETLLENLPIGVLVVRAPDGEVMMMNKAGQEISGRGVNTSINSDHYTEAYDVVSEDGKPIPTEELPLTITLKTGGTSSRDDMFLRHQDGSTVAVKAVTTPIKDSDGEIRRAVSVFEDISRQRELERSREEFFSIASHELRTPLTAIRGNSDLIEQYFGEKLDDPNLKEMVSDIHESATRLIDIVNDFLDTSRLEQKHMKFELEPVDVVQTARDVIKEYQVTGSRKRIHLEITTPEQPLSTAYADRNRTKQVLINLVGNALKFTDTGSITISFSEEKDFIKVYVADTGNGMSLEAQKLLFKKFEQTGSTILTRDSVRGTGLGLYISKMIVEQMHGSINLENSSMGVGTTFSFSLPLRPHENEENNK